jgi:excisionase family DNA binding protein
MSARLLTIRETCNELRASRATIYRLFAARELAFVQIGARRRVTADEIARFLAAHTVALVAEESVR